MSKIQLINTRFKIRPEWAYPSNTINQANYVTAINYLRKISKKPWILDTAIKITKLRAIK